MQQQEESGGWLERRGEATVLKIHVLIKILYQNCKALGASEQMRARQCERRGLTNVDKLESAWLSKIQNYGR